jgi:hypothetical protein
MARDRKIIEEIKLVPLNYEERLLIHQKRKLKNPKKASI